MRQPSEPTRTYFRSRRLFGGLLLAAVAALPAAADWLVLSDGKRVETKGAWEVKGKLVVFTLPNGSLSSLRASEVDLDASRAATEEALKPPPPPPPPPEKKKPVLVLTEKDLPPAVPPPTVEAGEEGEPAQPAAKAAGLEVAEWSQIEDPSGEGVQIFGTVRNTSQEIATSITLIVSLEGEDGKRISQKTASLSPSTLGPGASTNFRAVFPDVPAFATASFDIASKYRAAVGGTPPPAEETDN